MQILSLEGFFSYLYISLKITGIVIVHVQHSLPVRRPAKSSPRCSHQYF